ncbi:MAG TPA: amino acid adenylation domain-containing protein [Puia sp.]|nr:amino acid adenylation domain-containing protein [Puia sp.]
MNKDFTNDLLPVDFDPFAGPEILHVIPAIESQLEIWASCLIGGKEASLAFNESISLLFKGNFNRMAMEQSLQDLIKRHEALRTSFSADGKQICVYKELTLPVFYKDLSGEDRENQQEYINGYVKKDVNEPFDLLNGPLFRMALFKLADREHYLTLSAHHITCDGWSFGIIMEDLGKLYSAYVQGSLPDLPHAPQFGNYAEDQLNFEKSDEYKKTEQYWLDQYLHNVPLLDIPADYPRPENRTYKSRRDDYHLNYDLVTALKKIGAKAGCSLITSVIAAYEIYLYRLTGQQDIVLAVPTAGQSVTDNYGLVGHCVNLLPLRSNPDGNLSFIEYLKIRKPKILNDYDHQRVTLGSLLKKLNIARDPSRIPLVPLAFNIDMGMDNGVAFEGLTYELIINPREYENFEIFVNATGSEKSLVLEWSYNTQLFKPATIKKMMDEFEFLLESIIKDPLQKIGSLPVLSNAEEQKKFAAFNNTLTAYAAQKTVVDIFREQAVKTPDQVALRLANEVMTYAELDNQSNRLARCLIEKGVKNSDNIGLIASRGFDMIVAMYGIMKTGAAYVPIEPDYPLDRQQYILRQSDVQFLVTDEDDEIRNAISAERYLNIRSVNLNSYSDKPVNAKIDSTQLAYTIYTSGSTGRPKGVMIEHHSVVNLIEWVNKTFDIGREDRLLFITSMCFDLAVYDVFGMLAAGGTVVIAQKDEIQDVRKLQQMLLEYKITFWDSVPTTLDYLVKEMEMGKRSYLQESLRTVFLSGDWIPVSLPERLKKYFPNARFVSLGGATEGTIWSNYFIVDEVKSQWKSIPYGRPLQNNFFYILNEQLQPVPVGVIGELYIGGVGVARGYANDPEKTNYAFVKDPFNNKAGGRMYRTGDLGRMMPDMYMEFIGRKDSQVKIRGFRVELGEIENVLLQYKGIKHCVVVAKENKKGTKRLVAYVVVNGTFDKKEVTAYLKSKLTDYMVPELFIQIDNIPLSDNGKVDRKRLPDPDEMQDDDKKELVLPQTQIEKLVAGIFAELLGLEKVGVTDDFFELGGHSLIAAQVMSRIEQETGKKLPLTTLFKYSTVKQLASLLDEEGLKKKPDNTDNETGLVDDTAPQITVVPAIEPQVEIWVACVLGGEDANRSYNISLSEKLTGPLDKPAMERAMQQVINRHDSLRTTFSEDGKDMQIFSKWKLNLRFEDISSLNPDEQNNYLENFIKETSSTTFDLLNGPLHRFALFRLGKDQHYLTFTAHHIICDGWSLGLIMQELGKLYSAYAKGESPELSEAPEFSEFAEQQLAFYRTEEYMRNLQYWTDQFKDNVPVLDIPTDFPRPANRTYKGHRGDFELGKNLMAELTKLGSSAGCSLPITLRAAFEMFLYRLTGQDDIVLGLPAAGQLTNANYGLVGHCVNLLPVRSKLVNESTFLDYLKSRKNAILDAYDHSQLTFGALLKQLNIARDNSRIPLVPVSFNIETGADDGVSFYGIKHEMVFNPREFETFDISITNGGTEESPMLLWSYNTHLFKLESIQKMMDDFKSLLAVIIQKPDIRLNDIPVLAKPKIVIEPLEFTYPADRSIVDLFAEQVAKTPKKTAFVFEGIRLTYQELDYKTNQLAHYLVAKGVQGESLVPICVGRSPETIIGILGILKAGGAYVPIDPEYPADRINYMLKDTSADIVVTNSLYKEKLFADSKATLVLMDSDWSIISKEPKSSLNNTITPGQLAYIIYTSGSTGRPKGVMIEHKNVVSLVKGIGYVKLSEQSVLLSTGSPSFDATTFEYWGMLLNGGELVLCDEETLFDTRSLKKVIAENKVNIMWVTSGLLNQWVDLDIMIFEKLQTVLAGGEKLSEKHIEKLKRKFPAISIINGYGPTENTTFSLTYLIHSSEIPHPIPIGRALNSRSAYILNSHMQLCAVGEEGELYVGGAGIGRGYLNLPELTREKFMPDLFNVSAGAMMYRTGDIAKWLADGNVEFLGRIDDQVKIRGFRIELGEIESVLKKCSGVKDAVIIAKEDRDGIKRLVGYVVAENSFDKENIMSYLQQHLPDYMIPKLLIELNKIPLTANGKADKKALPDPGLLPEFGKRKHKAPRTETEKIVAGIFSDALGLAEISIDDDFFEMGGHSLIAIKVMKILEEKTGQKLPITSLFSAPTVEKLSALLKDESVPIVWKSLVPIKPEGNKPPLYIVHGSGLTVMVFNSLAKELSENQPVYGLQAYGLNGEEPFDTIEEIATHYINEIVAYNPDGPYLLAGYSFGGKVVFEMAKQLKAMGKEVRLVAIFDTNVAGADNFLSSSQRWKKKIVRQFPKALFVFQSFAKYPADTIKYQFNFFFGKIRSLLEKAGMLNSLPAEEEQLSVYAKRINEAYFKAYANYKMIPYDGVIDLFRVTKRLYYLDDPVYLGWNAYALKGVNIYDIPGDHKTFLLGTNYIALAKTLQKCIDEHNKAHEKGSYRNTILKAV